MSKSTPHKVNTKFFSFNVENALLKHTKRQRRDRILQQTADEKKIIKSHELRSRIISETVPATGKIDTAPAAQL
jgi:hypothetical protein